MDSSKVIRSPPRWISICNHLPWELSQAFRNPVNSINMCLSLYICKLPPTYLHLRNKKGTSSTIFLHPLLFCQVNSYQHASLYVNFFFVTLSVLHIPTKWVNNVNAALLDRTSLFNTPLEDTFVLDIAPSHCTCLKRKCFKGCSHGRYQIHSLHNCSRSYN